MNTIYYTIYYICIYFKSNFVSYDKREDSNDSGNFKWWIFEPPPDIFGFFLSDLSRWSAASMLIFVQGIIFGTNILSKVKIVSVIQKYKGHNCLSNTSKVKQTFWQRRDLADLFLFWYFCQYLFVIHFYIFLHESELNFRDFKSKFFQSFLSFSRWSLLTKVPSSSQVINHKIFKTGFAEELFENLENQLQVLHKNGNYLQIL